MRKVQKKRKCERHLSGKLLVALVLCMAVLGSLFGGCQQETKETENENPCANMDPITIKYAHAIAEGELMNYFIEDWMAAVAEQSGGKITFDYYPHGELGTFVEIIEQVELGTVDMSSGEPSLYEPWCPEVSMLYAPMICDDYDHLGRCIYGKPGELIEESMAEKNNTYILDWVYAGARVIASNRSLRSLEDMKGMLIRSPESQVYLDTFTLLGMYPTPMPMNKMYQAIQQGVVEGCECPAQALYEGGYHTITGNICKTRHMFALGTLSANQKFWDNLPQEARDLMMKVWNEKKDDFNERVQASEDDYYARFEEEGTVVTEFEDRAAFRDVAKSYWSEKAASIGGKAGAILAAINELRE